uniref:Major facilitator superfamily (MFS) profile domain-containing protein n=1 Tax=Plectus sambesii TaxID=2011161 RepID=A0A914WHE7_9BILA
MTVVHPSGAADHKPSTTGHSWLLSVRLLTAVLLCLCFASVHIMNSNMGMAIVCMVNSTVHNSTAENSYHGTLDWSPEVQGYIFSAFNVGLLFMLATGWFADKLNAKYILTASVLLATAANIIIPLGSVNSFAFAILGRVLVGFADALLQPTVNSLLTRWFPPNERSYALGLATGGRQLGTLLILPTAGLLCAQTEFLGGWPSIFYVSSMTGAVFVAIWLVFGADKPSKHWLISKGEVEFIAVSNALEQMDDKRKHRKVPWARLLTSAPVWASVVSLVCHEFPLITMIMFLPSYLKDVLKYESSKNGFISALPTACLWLSKLGSSYLNTWLQTHTSWKRTTIVKVLNSIGSLGLGCFLFAATFLDESW